MTSLFPNCPKLNTREEFLIKNCIDTGGEKKAKREGSRNEEQKGNHLINLEICNTGALAL
jgi:hypothetical protein